MGVLLHEIRLLIIPGNHGELPPRYGGNNGGIVPGCPPTRFAALVSRTVATATIARAQDNGVMTDKGERGTFINFLREIEKRPCVKIQIYKKMAKFVQPPTWNSCKAQCLISPATPGWKTEIGTNEGRLG